MHQNHPGFFKQTIPHKNNLGWHLKVHGPLLLNGHFYRHASFRWCHIDGENDLRANFEKCLILQIFTGVTR